MAAPWMAPTAWAPPSSWAGQTPSRPSWQGRSASSTCQSRPASRRRPRPQPSAAPTLAARRPYRWWRPQQTRPWNRRGSGAWSGVAGGFCRPPPATAAMIVAPPYRRPVPTPGRPRWMSGAAHSAAHPPARSPPAAATAAPAWTPMTPPPRCCRPAAAWTVGRRGRPPRGGVARGGARARARAAARADAGGRRARARSPRSRGGAAAARCGDPQPPRPSRSTLRQTTSSTPWRGH